MAKRTLQDTLPLPNSAVRIPQLGFGLWQSAPDVCVQSCLTALREGYRHFDTAQIYGNEKEVGDAVRRSGLPRADLFVTTKIMFPADTPEATYAKCCASVQKLGGSRPFVEGSADADPDAYVDLFLIHSPIGGPERRKALWLALERLHAEGKARSIGVSNFGVGQIEEMQAYASTWPPHANQIELHPWCQQKDIVAYCDQQGIVVEAYCPIVRNRKADDPTVAAIARKHSSRALADPATPAVTPNQVLLRFALQRGWVPLPKSDKPARIHANADLYGFDLDNQDMASLNSLDQGTAGATFLAVKNEAGDAGELQFGGGAKDPRTVR